VIHSTLVGLEPTTFLVTSVWINYRSLRLSTRRITAAMSAAVIVVLSTRSVDHVTGTCYDVGVAVKSRRAGRAGRVGDRSPTDDDCNKFVGDDDDGSSDRSVYTLNVGERHM